MMTNNDKDHIRLKQRLHHQANQPEKMVSVFGKKIKQSDLIKVIGLIVFFGLLSAVVWALWPLLSMVFETGGVDKLIDYITSRGPLGVLILFGLQLVQIIVAFIPGEVVQIAAGMMYGPLGGAAIILAGCLVSSALIYELVHRLGAPFVLSMVGEKQLLRFRRFELSGKFEITIFILYLIPGFPKDILTYVVPLSDMRLKTFLIISTIGRCPGVILSTFAAAGLADGNIVTSVILFGILAVIAIMVVVLRKRIIAVLARRHPKQK